jgi:pyruvate dehydrogenase E2 component (dihydrolipoamide acetyltransferase)
LDKKGKQRIMQLLQKSVAAPAAKPAAGAQPAAAPQADAPVNPATGKPLTEPERAAHQAAGGEFDGDTGAPLPLGTKASNPEGDFEKKLADLQAKRAAEKAAAQPAAAPAAAAPAAAPEQPSTGQAAAAAQAAGQDPEQAALAAMQKNNPNLQKLMAKNKQPVNISGKKKAAAPQQQVASKEPKGNMVAEGFSIFRKR